MNRGRYTPRMSTGGRPPAFAAAAAAVMPEAARPRSQRELPARIQTGGRRPWTAEDIHANNARIAKMNSELNGLVTYAVICIQQHPERGGTRTEKTLRAMTTTLDAARRIANDMGGAYEIDAALVGSTLVFNALVSSIHGSVRDFEYDSFLAQIHRARDISAVAMAAVAAED